MDFDLEIISEEGYRPDPLFCSIISAMNSMKEATADKIYQKIQREGATNYSKPQVDRALASALKYGIFEVKNNRYRVRDDVLDDVDTVYWKMQRKRDQTPFRTQEGINERQLGQKLDPEKDNLRFKKMSGVEYASDKEVQECPQCGRTKRPSPEKKHEVKAKREKREKINVKSKESSKNSKEKKKNSLKKTRKYEEEDDACEEFRSAESKRKLRSDSAGSEAGKPRRRGLAVPDPLNLADAKHFNDEAFATRPKKEFMPGGGKYDTTDESELDSMSFLSDDEQSFGSYQVKPRSKPQKNERSTSRNNNNNTANHQFSRFDSECEDILTGGGDKAKTVRTRSTDSTAKSESDSEMSSLTDEPSKSNNNFYDGGPKASRIKAEKYFTTSKLYEGDDESARKSDWFGYPEDPQGAIIQSNNVLRIEPMDSIAFKGPEHTSYIS